MGRRDHRNDDSFVRGSANIDRQIREAVEKLRQKGDHVVVAAKRALNEGANIIVADMQRRVPVRTGRLKTSIRLTSLEDGALYVFSANAKNPRDNFLYGPVVEFAEWHVFKGRRRKKKRKAFMYPAFDAHRDEVNRMVEDAISRAITSGA